MNSSPVVAMEGQSNGYSWITQDVTRGPMIFSTSFLGGIMAEHFHGGEGLKASASATATTSASGVHTYKCMEIHDLGTCTVCLVCVLSVSLL